MNVSVNYSENVEPDFQLGIDFVFNSLFFFKGLLFRLKQSPFTMMRQIIVDFARNDSCRITFTFWFSKPEFCSPHPVTLPARPDEQLVIS